MSSDSYRQRREAAVSAVSQILAQLRDEPQNRRILLWSGRFEEIGATLTDSDEPDRTAVESAKELFDRLYVGGRNITDFYLVRTDFDEQRRLNLIFEEKVEALGRILDERNDGDLS
ncbi:hypothetical protein [Nocardia sp. NBC_01388]|uniref:hypothetical protein n=1 Tax=Nocardia sp. NBC_01388 TaxID=2903596 RepID=UPI00324AE446